MVDVILDGEGESGETGFMVGRDQGGDEAREGGEFYPEEEE